MMCLRKTVVPESVVPELYALLTDGAGHIVNRTASQMIRVNRPHEIVFDTGTSDWFLTNPARPIALSATVIDNDGDNDGTMHYAWDLDNDGITDTNAQTPSTSYLHSQIENTETSHTINLTITDRNNLSVTKTGTVKVVNTTKGSLFTNEYWSGTHVLEGRVEIPVGITLTTAPLTTVNVSYNPDPLIGYDYGLLVKGTLHAQPGTKFGIPDTVEDKWKGIDIEGVASLDTVTIEDAERGITVIPGSNATITGCVLNNNIAGIHVYGTAQLITGTLFTNNLYGVKEEIGASPVLTNCIFDHNTIDYYHKTLTRITMDELNLLPGNSGNARQGE